MCYGTILWDRVHKARKMHRCDVCGRAIEPGNKYRSTGGKDGSELMNMAYCGKCATRLAITDHNDTDGDGCISGDLKEIAQQHAKASGWRRFRGVMRRARERLFGELKEGEK